MNLSPPDPYEAGGDAKAASNWTKLQELEPKWSDAEITLVNFLRRLYRACTPRLQADNFVPGGSLVFNGAHIRLMHDRGAYYDTLWSQKAKLGALKGGIRKSSHQSTRNQYEIRLPEAGCVLVGYGAYPDGAADEHTWLQCEHHSMTGVFMDKVWHICDYFSHLYHNRQQVGPFGYSPYSEKAGRDNPLIARSLPEYEARST